MENFRELLYKIVQPKEKVYDEDDIEIEEPDEDIPYEQECDYYPDAEI